MSRPFFRLGLPPIAMGLFVVAVGCSASNGSGHSAGGLSASGGGDHGGGASTATTGSGEGSMGGGGGLVVEVGGSGAGGSVPLTDVDVVITADNAYSFGYGDKDGINHFIQGSRSQTAGQIFNCGEGPEAYTVPASAAPPSAYLYIVTWDDLEVTQGVLGQFVRKGGMPLYTGDPQFQVCATGIDFSTSQVGPTDIEVNQQIAVCNAASGDRSTTSAGWVDGHGAVTPNAIGELAVGEANDPTPGGTFPPACPTGSAPPGSATIDPAAHWMWYQPGGIADPFQSTGMNTFRAYLIFRVAAHDLPPPPK